MEKAKKIENLPRKLAAIVATGTVAVSLVACNDKDESGGGSAFGGFGGDKLIYGSECAEHPDNTTPEGISIHNQWRSDEGPFASGKISSENELSDEVIVDIVENINHKLSAEGRVANPIEVSEQADSIRQGAKALFDSYADPDGRMASGEGVPALDAHVLEDGTVCVAGSSTVGFDLEK